LRGNPSDRAPFMSPFRIHILRAYLSLFRLFKINPFIKLINYDKLIICVYFTVALTRYDRPNVAYKIINIATRNVNNNIATNIMTCVKVEKLYDFFR